MPFKLPKYSDLTNQQRAVLNLPFDRNHLVTGAPGTGKSVIAIYRASDLCEAGRNVLMLVYNRPLKMYISSAIDSLGIGANVDTWQSWLPKFYKNEFGKSYPKINGEKFTYDWPEIKHAFSCIGEQFDQIIVDEAQDVPLELIECLCLISKGVTCFMDERQSIVDMYTDSVKVAEALGVRTAYALYDNFRNCQGIYDFAKIFNPSAVSDPINKDKTKPSMIKCSLSNITTKMIQVIKRNYGLNYIGVFVNNNKLRDTYEKLSNALDDMDVFMYKSMTKDFGELDFDEPGVYILSYNTMKGLEFDAVLLPTPECIKSSFNTAVDNNLVYVAVTRASKKLYGFYINNQSSSPYYINFFGQVENRHNLADWE